jgi:ABC-2 type transport system permease protein
MTRLVRAEIRRAAGRRIVQVFAGFSGIAALVIGAVALRSPADEVANTAIGIIKGAGASLALAAWVIGASLLGAEFQSRGMTTTLTFVPQRSKVYVAKALAMLAVVGTWVTATLALLYVAMLPALGHATAAATNPTGLDYFGAGARGVALALVMGALGFALSGLGRATSAALGIGFGYVIVVEQILGNVIAGWRRWLLLGNVIGWVSGDPSGVGVDARSLAGAGLFLALVAAGALCIGGATFWRRDIA